MIDRYKDVMKQYPTGVTIVTTMNNDFPVGLTVNSFASVSINPLLILWCIDKKSRSLQAFLDNDSFAVNILAENQENTCFLFSKEKQNRFNRVDWKLSDHNLPIIKDSYALLECEKQKHLEAGDHYILIGKVINIEKSNKKPLLYYNRNVQPVIEKMAL